MWTQPGWHGKRKSRTALRNQPALIASKELSKPGTLDRKPHFSYGDERTLCLQPVSVNSKNEHSRLKASQYLYFRPVRGSAVIP